MKRLVKAAMFKRGILFPPTHNLAGLALTLHGHGIVVPCPADGLQKSNPFAKTLRYDDTSIPLISAGEAGRVVNAMHCRMDGVVK